MKQFFTDLGWTIVDLLESIGDLIAYNIIAIKWTYDDIRDAVKDTWEDIKTWRFDDDDTTRFDD